MKRRRVLFGLALALTDADMSLLAFYMAYRVRVMTQGPKIGPFSDYLALAAMQMVSTLVVFFFYKFYHRRHVPSTIDEFYRIFVQISIATLLTIAFAGLSSGTPSITSAR